MINSRIDLERLEALVRNCSPGKSHKQLREDCRTELNRLAHEYARNAPRGWQQVQSIVTGLRSQFTLDRMVQYSPSDAVPDSDSTVLNQFLQQRRVRTIICDDCSAHVGPPWVSNKVGFRLLCQPSTLLEAGRGDLHYPSRRSCLAGD